MSGVTLGLGNNPSITGVYSQVHVRVARQHCKPNLNKHVVKDADYFSDLRMVGESRNKEEGKRGREGKTRDTTKCSYFAGSIFHKSMAKFDFAPSTFVKTV